MIMGVVNLTPDSFSDGGRWLEPEAGTRHGQRLIEWGADLIDVGGESTRPGASRPSAQEELARVLPVIQALAPTGCPISIDTMRASVAQAALEAGASLVNDVSGGLADEAMVPWVAEAGVPYIAMHWRGHSREMDRAAVYTDVVSEVTDALRRRRDQLWDAGIGADRLVLDPGFGFAKDAGHNWQLLAGLESLVQTLQTPVLVGTSRKRFLGRLRPEQGQHPPADPTPPGARDHATAATSLLAAQAGAWGVRVHDVPSTRDALDVHVQVAAAARSRGAGSHG